MKLSAIPAVAALLALAMPKDGVTFGAAGVADRGTERQQTAEWRCYFVEELEFFMKGKGCADAYGNPLERMGTVNGDSIEHITDQKIEKELKTLSGGFCKIHLGADPSILT
ncbi:microneme protein [Cyclospora cayetanensis]|uniref:Microneme protein n=1 Tax=Cyclospora cayetanensis TaxID=88456 RepID=A0A1D3D767_9EIME|nr:microneme protein [Cyclospora cayetanensis]